MVTAPSGRRREIRPLDDEEAARLLATAADDRLGILWLTMLALGLRLGEALGLRWEDLDLDVGTVAIHRTLQRQRGERDGETGRRQGRLVESTPKTEAATAVLPLPIALGEALRRHRAAQNRARLAATFWSDPTMVFTTRVGTPLEPRNVHRAWTALSDRARVRRSRPHDLRHTTATFLLAEGVDLKVIQKTLRHSRYQTTADTYAHVADSLQVRAATAMDGVLKHLAPDQRGAATSAAKA
jgi:integrase